MSDVTMKAVEYGMPPAIKWNVSGLNIISELSVLIHCVLKCYEDIQAWAYMYNYPKYSPDMIILVGDDHDVEAHYLVRKGDDIFEVAKIHYEYQDRMWMWKTFSGNIDTAMQEAYTAYARAVNYIQNKYRKV